jgi:hypothetical protein
LGIGNSAQTGAQRQRHAQCQCVFHRRVSSVVTTGLTNQGGRAIAKPQDSQPPPLQTQRTTQTSSGSCCLLEQASSSDGAAPARAARGGPARYGSRPVPRRYLGSGIRSASPANEAPAIAAESRLAAAGSWQGPRSLPASRIRLSSRWSRCHRFPDGLDHRLSSRENSNWACTQAHNPPGRRPSLSLGQRPKPQQGLFHLHLQKGGALEGLFR